MGFGLHCVRFDDASDPVGFRRFLDERRLTLERAEGSKLCGLRTADGTPLHFQGEDSPTTLLVTDPDSSQHVNAHLSPARLTEDELRFIYDLCVAANLAIVNPQGDIDDSAYPGLLVPARNHSPDEVQRIADETGLNHGYVDSVEELFAVLL